MQKQYTIQNSQNLYYNQNQTGPVGLVIDILRVQNHANGIIYGIK